MIYYNSKINQLWIHVIGQLWLTKKHRGSHPEEEWFAPGSCLPSTGRAG